MSRRKFLHEINNMTRKGVYPSLRILLEEDEENKDDPMGGDDPFGDEGEGEGEGESGEGGGGDEGEGSGDDSLDPGAGLDSPSPEEEKEAENIGNAAEVDNLNKNLSMVNSYNPEELHTKIANKLLPHAGVEFSTVDFRSEKDKVSESYSLKTFMLLNEDLKDKVEDAVKVIDDMQDDINKVDGYVKSLELKGKGKKIDIPALINRAIELSSHFDQHYCKFSIVAADALKTVIKQSELGKEEENCETFIADFVQELDKKGLDHSISINTVKQSDYDIGTGARTQS